MALTGSWPTQDAAGASIATTRRMVSGEFQRPGIIGAAPTVTGRADGAYNVGAFQAVTQRTSAGMERLANDGSIIAGDTLTAPPASNSRIEVIWVRSRFALLGDSVSTPEVGVTLGTAAASPTKPAIPAGALELATARRYSTDTTTQTVTITTTAPFTALVGGPIRVRDAADMAALAAADGDVALRLDQAGRVYRRVSGSWIPELHAVHARTTAYSFTTAKTILTFGSSPVDGALDGAFTTGDYGTFTCVAPGVYQVAALVTAAGAGTTAVGLELFKNTAAVRGANAATNTISWTSLQVVHTLRLAAGDTISLRFSSSATVAAVVSDASLNNVCIDYVRP